MKNVTARLFTARCT